MPKEHPIFASIPNKLRICLDFPQTLVQLSKSVYLHVQLTVFSTLAHMLLRYTNVRKSLSAIKIWLKIGFAREVKYDTHPISALHTSCSSAGERAQRKLWVEVLFLQTRLTVLSCRDIRDYMSKNSKKTRTENTKRSWYLLFSWHS